MSTSPDSAEELASTTASPSTNIIDEALKRVRELNPALSATLQREVDALREGRSFGLVFERHLPESVRLNDYPIKRGVKVARRHPGTNEETATWRVLRTEGTGSNRKAWLLRPGVDGQRGVEEPVPVPLRELVAVREFGEPVFPGLQRVGEPLRRAEAGAPNHVVINGENFHALQVLKMTHRAAVDLIYIDPPYNTGNKGWIYNDRYVAEQDGNKHAKWLSFMERRLTIARDLLKDTGVIFVAIGDDEHHRLRMLLDQTLGPQNFISNIVWLGGRKNDSRHVSNGADYMLVYAKDISTWKVTGYRVKDSPDVSSLRSTQVSEKGARWWGGKAGVELALAAAQEIWDECDGDHAEATKRWRAWMRDFKKAGSATDAVTRFTTLDVDGRPMRTDGDLRSPNLRENLHYDVLHPVTGKPVVMHPNGWVCEKSEMARYLAEGRVHFGPDHTTTAYLRRYLDEQDKQVAESVFVRDRTAGSEHLEAVLGDKRFPNPKDVNVLQHWIGLSTPKDAVIVDFFGGSGTTSEAVMRLNAEDGGVRQSILVTNNELAAGDAATLTKQGVVPGDPAWEARGVFEHVTRPRISTIVNGVRPDKSKYSDGLDANVDFFRLTYLDPDRVSAAKEFEAIAPLLWLKAGAPAEYIATESEDGYAVTTAYAILTDTDASERFVKRLVDMDEAPRHVFVVTDSTSEFEHVTGLLPDSCRSTRLYESYLRNFAINVEVS